MTRAPGARRVAAARPHPVAVDRAAASRLSVARIAVDVPLAHLDRPFDYLVAEPDSETAQPGVRVRVRFSGRLVDGFILERVDHSDHGGRLAFLDRVVSPEVVLTEPVAALCRAVADRFAGTMADVLRLAVPPRHARTEQPESGAPAGAMPPEGAQAGVMPAETEQGIAAGWAKYPAGPSFLGAVRAGRPARAVWQALPGEDWPLRFAKAARAASAAGRGALLLVPDARDLARLAAALAAVLPADSFEALSADLGPAERYRRFLAISRGQCRVVAGTRAATFAPVTSLGLIALFDDGDDLYAEPRAPYPHAREVAMIRSGLESAALLIGGYTRTAEGQLLVESGWSKPIVASRDAVRVSAPRIEAAGDSYAVGADSAAARARLSPAAFAAARSSLDAGAPVLIQVPRGGYLPSLACVECGRPARCRRCSGPLAVPRGARTPVCRWCGVTMPRWVCPACASERLRATVTGAARTAEELGRAFPGVRLRTSAAGKVIDRLDAGPAIVVATPGAEPVADGGYGAALLLDGALLLGRPDLRAGEEALRRWMAAATLVRPAGDGGRVIVGADVALPAVQALLRWDPATFAAMELSERRELGFPPAMAMASLDGTEEAIAAISAELTAQPTLPESAALLGPVPAPPARRTGRADKKRTRAGREADSSDAASATNDAHGHSGGRDGASDVTGVLGVDDADASDTPRMRLLVRVPPGDRRALAGALRILAASRALRKEPDAVRIEIDPAELG